MCGGGTRDSGSDGLRHGKLFTVAAAVRIVESLNKRMQNGGGDDDDGEKNRVDNFSFEQHSNK